MKGINTDETKMREFGWEEIHSEDHGAAYEVDQAKLYKKDKKYAMLMATGCSCWEGNFEGWIDLSKKKLLKLAYTWSTADAYNKGETELGKWVLANKDKI